MKAFDLEEAKKGAIIQTRSGKPVRIICYDRIDVKRRGNIVALIDNGNGWERTVQYTSQGHVATAFEPALDLLIKEDNE